MSIKLSTAFLDRVQRSGLVAADEMPQLRHDLEVRGVDLDRANAIADALVDMQVLTRWQADKVLEGKHKGFFLGSYRLLRPLGRGGMGAVFLAQHEMMRRQCAIKVLPHSQIKEGSSVLKRFYVEAQAVAALDHQNIVRAYDVAMESKDGKDIHYLVMEFVEGHDLQTLVQERGVLEYVKTAEYLRQTANGLAHAHEAGLVHRDIKPANLLVDKKGVVKILDLGLARFFDDSEQASLTTAFNETVLGTADYLSPEQALNSHTVDHRTDIYSLGCTAYFMLIGTPPFPEGTVAQRLVAHQVKSPKPIKETRSDAPKDLVAIIDKMMAKRPEDRFATAEELAAVLARWLIEYGGEDWKRQHSEITGNKALMSLLSAREPTRTIRSSMSETELELELAPLDDDDDAGVVSSSSASGSNLNLTGSGIRKAGESSASRRRRAVAEDHDSQLAASLDDHDEGATAGSKPAEATSLSDTAGSESLLPPLDEGIGAEVEPLADLEVSDLGSLGTGDLLGDLDHQDLMGVGSGDSLMGAMDSQLQQVTLGSSGSSASKSHRRSQSSAEKGDSASASIIGWPILIGGAGGLLLVLIILALFQMSSAPEVPQLAPGEQVAAIPQAEDSPEPDNATTSDMGSADVSPDAGQQPAQSLVEAPAQNPPIQPAEQQPDSGQQPDAERQPPDAMKPAREPGEETQVPSEPQHQPARKIEDIVTSAAGSQPAADSTESGVSESTETPLAESPEVAPTVETIPPEVYLAAIEGFRVEVKDLNVTGVTRPKIPPQLAQLLSNILMATRRELEDNIAKRYRLEFDVSQKPLLTLEPTMMVQASNIHLGMKAEMTVEDDSGQTVTIWSSEKELVSFMPTASPTIVKENARKEIGRLFSDFRDKYEAAVAAHRAP
jgi:serine/threonine protein kinase/cytoskeletal protein RodZ